MVTRAGDITPATVFCLVTTVVRLCAVIIPAVTAAVVMTMKKRAKREKVAAKRRKRRNDKTMIVLPVYDFCRRLVHVCCILEPVFKLVSHQMMLCF